MNEPMECKKLIIVGRIKRMIRCRAFALLRLRETEQLDNVVTSLFKEFGENHTAPINRWVDILIELNTRNPKYDLVLPKFQEEKKEIERIVRYFKGKVLELETDPTIPTRKIDENGNETIDYTTLEGAKRTLADYENQVNFINECILEIMEKLN